MKFVTQEADPVSSSENLMTQRRKKPPQSQHAVHSVTAERLSRSLAAILYAHDMRQRSIADLRQEEMQFAAVSMSTLERWSAADGWTHKREVFWNEIEIQSARKQSQRLHEFLERQLGDLMALYDKGMTALQGEVVKPKSYEGLMRSVLEVAERIDLLRDRRVELAPGQMPAVTSEPIVPEEYLVEFSHLVLRFQNAIERGATIRIVEVESGQAA